MANPKTTLIGSGWRKSLPNPRKRVIDMANVIGQLRDQAQNSGTSGTVGNNGGGGGGAAAVSTLAGLPPSPELDALLKSGMIREGMAPEQALAIMAASKLGTQVPIDIAALKAMVAGDYATSTNGVMGPATDWMQQLFGANAPGGAPSTNWDYRDGHWYDENGVDRGTAQTEDSSFVSNDPNFQMYMNDPIFSEYAGGLQQMEETAETNQATDQAWFDKQQQAMTDYYNGLMASIGSAAPVSGGGGGGGGGGRRGGGGGGSGGGGDWGDIANPYEFGDPKTKATEQQRITQTSTSDMDEMAPNYWRDLITNGAAAAAEAGMSPEDQAIFNEYINSSSTKYTGNPNQIMSAATVDWEDMIAQDEIQRQLGEQNAEFDRNAPDQLNAELSNYLMSNNLELGDDPNQVGLQTFRPMLDPETGEPIPVPASDNPAMDVANREAQQPLLDKLNAIFGAAHAPGAGQAFDPSSAMLNKLFTYVSSQHNQDPAGEAARLAAYNGPYSDLDFGIGGKGVAGGQPAVPAAAQAGGGNKVAAGNANQQGGYTPGPSAADLFVPSVLTPSNVSDGISTSVDNLVASQHPYGDPLQDPAYTLNSPAGNTPTPAETGVLDNNEYPVSLDQAIIDANAARENQDKVSARPTMDLATLQNIRNVIASQFPPSTATTPQGSVAGASSNPMLANGSQPPTMTPTGIPIGTQTTGPAPPGLPPTAIYGQKPQMGPEPDAGSSEWAATHMNGSQQDQFSPFPVPPPTEPTVNTGFGSSSIPPQTWGNKSWDPSQMGGWHMPPGVAPTPTPNVQQGGLPGFGNPDMYPPGEQFRAQLNQANPRPNAEANIQAIVDQLYNKVRNPTTFSGNAPVGNDPYVAPPVGTVDWASGGTPTTTTPQVPFGSSRMMPENLGLGLNGARVPSFKHMPMGGNPGTTGDDEEEDTTAPESEPAPTAAPATAPVSGSYVSAGKVLPGQAPAGVDLAQLAQTVLNARNNPASIPRAPQTVQSMLANINPQGVSFAPASQQLLQDAYSGNSAALDAAYQAWLAQKPAESGQAVGGTRMVTPGNVYGDWQISRFDPKSGMISDQVMDILHGTSYNDFVRSLPAGTDIEQAMANNPGKVWQTPETPEQLNARQVQEAANRWLIAPSREASTWWHPAIWKNRDQTVAQEQSTVNSSATSTMPEAALPGLVDTIQDPRLMEEPEDTLDYTDPEQIMDDSEVVGWRNPANTQMFTKPPAAVTENINNFVGGLKHTANPQQAVKRAATNRLQAKQTLGGYSKGGGKKAVSKLGGKY